MVARMLVECGVPSGCMTSLRTMIGVLAACIGIEGHRLQNAVGALAFGLHRGAAVKAPERHVGKGRRLVKRLDQSLAAQFRNGLFCRQARCIRVCILSWISLKQDDVSSHTNRRTQLIKNP